MIGTLPSSLHKRDGSAVGGDLHPAPKRLAGRKTTKDRERQHTGRPDCTDCSHVAGSVRGSYPCELLEMFGGRPSNCGNASRISYQGAFDSTLMCRMGVSLGSRSKVAMESVVKAGIDSDRLKSRPPHCWQEKRQPVLVLYSRSISSPLVIRK